MIKIDATFNLYILQKRFKTVAEHLNAEGHRTFTGAYFTGQSIARILRDKKHLENGTVSQELWDQCQDIMAAQIRGGGSKRRVVHLCSGLLSCGCGQTMYVPSNSKKYVCANCRNKISKDDLEAIVVEHLRQLNLKDVQQALGLWPTLSLQERREVVESTVEKIIAEKNGRVVLTLYAAT